MATFISSDPRDAYNTAYWQGSPSSEEIARAAGQTAPQNADAMARLRSVLDSYGLGGLSDWAWGMITSGASEELVAQQLRERPEYAARFPALAQRRQAGLAPISEAEYVTYERQARQMMQSAGLPAGFYDQPGDFTNFIGRDLSLSELSARITDGFGAATAAPREVRDQLRTLYGIDEGGLAAYFLDPNRALPVLQRQFAAARAAGVAQRTGFGQLQQDYAERFAELGTTEAEMERGFGQLIESKELFSPLAGQEATEDRITEGEQLGATFAGNAAAAERIRRRTRSRQAQFGGGGSLGATREGVSGLGSAAV